MEIFVWTFEGVVQAVVLGFVILCLLVVWLGSVFSHARKTRKQKRCKHDGGINETSACDAICRQCGKNLGFIGNWRGKR